MRTTLVIPDPVLDRARRLAQQRKATLSEVVTEALEVALTHGESMVRERPAPYRVKPVAMGIPTVDLSNREELYRRMEE